jgi:hypothetical protein
MEYMSQAKARLHMQFLLRFVVRFSSSSSSQKKEIAPKIVAKIEVQTSLYDH